MVGSLLLCTPSVCSFSPSISRCFSNSNSNSNSSNSSRKRVAPMRIASCAGSVPALLAALVVFSSSVAELPDGETLSNVPQELSGEDKKHARIQRPRSRAAETCTSKCVSTCILGGSGSPGEGPFNVRRPLIVFKQGFRSRNYCLTECSDVCNLIKDGEDGP